MDLKKHISLTRLIFQYLTENLSDPEAKELEDWVNQSEIHRSYFKEFNDKNLWAEKQEKIRQYDVQEGWKAVLKKKKKHNRHWHFLQMAASILILLGSLAIYRYAVSPSVPVRPVVEKIQPGKRTARLLTASGEIVNLDTLRQAELQKSIIWNENGTLFFQSKDEKNDRKQKYNYIEVPPGGEFELKLPDGTTVFLNSETRLRFPGYFIPGQERRVYLTGEAYFEVAPDSTSPFVVSTHHTSIKVLGTSFNVMAYPEQPQELTTLVNGSVMLGAKTTGEFVRLAPGQQGCYDLQQKTLSNYQVETSYFTSWKDGIFAFSEQPLGKVMETLSRWYLFDVVYLDKDIPTVVYTGKIARHASIQEVLHILELLDEVQFEIQGNQVIVAKK